MAELNVRSDAVDVEDIMRQIRARIREKRGADYTEAELQELARVKLDKFLDPKGVRSDLLEAFRSRRAAHPPLPNYEFEDDTLYETHRGLLRALRRLLRPVLKLFFNPDKITTALHLQSQINAQTDRRLGHEALWYELMNNMTVEITRLGIEVQNLKMRVESLSSRVDFDERRARALEGVVQYRPQTRAPATPAVGSPEAPSAPAAIPGARPGQPGAAPGDSGSGRRRRRRRRRRPGQTMADQQGGGWRGNGGNQGGTEQAAGPAGTDDGDRPGASEALEPDDHDGPDDSGQ